jgi:hypothetical protein
MRRGLSIVLLILILFSTGVTAHGEASSIIVDIKVASFTVKADEYLPVSATIRNVGTKEQSLQMWSCSYPEQWAVDNPIIHLMAVSCNKNVVVHVRLKPDEAYEMAVSIYIERSAEHQVQKSVTFRLGLKPNIFEKTGLPSPIWSNAITLRVIE